MLSVAVRLPLAAGVKVTLILQLPPAATELPQVLLCAKSLGLVPVIVRLDIDNASLLELLRVVVCVPLVEPTDTLPKERLPGETAHTGEAAATPVPLRLTVLLPNELLVSMLRVAKRNPVVLGVKVRLIVQLAPGSSVSPQLSVCANLLA